MFNIGTFELVALAVIALLVFGPEKLPKVAADAARLLRELRQMATGARRELSEALGPEFDEFKNMANLSDLNPRTFVKKNLLDVLDDDSGTATTKGAASPPSGGAPTSGTANRGSGRSAGPAGTPASGDTATAPPQQSSPQPPQGFDADTT